MNYTIGELIVRIYGIIIHQNIGPNITFNIPEHIHKQYRRILQNIDYGENENIDWNNISLDEYFNLQLVMNKILIEPTVIIPKTALLHKILNKNHDNVLESIVTFFDICPNEDLMIKISNYQIYIDKYKMVHISRNIYRRLSPDEFLRLLDGRQIKNKKRIDRIYELKERNHKY